MIAPGTPLHQIPFIAVDLETTGFDPVNDAIVEIGGVKVQGGKIVDEFQSLISIDRHIPTGAQRVHGITSEMLAGQPTIGEVLPRFLAFAGEGALVEHSFRAFDVLFLENAHGKAIPLPYLNTCSLSRKLFPFIKKHSLEECCRRHQILNEQQHRALSDARASAQLLLRLLEACGSRYPTLQDLATVASVER